MQQTKVDNLLRKEVETKHDAKAALAVGKVYRPHVNRLLPGWVADLVVHDK